MFEKSKLFIDVGNTNIKIRTSHNIPNYEAGKTITLDHVDKLGGILKFISHIYISSVSSPSVVADIRTLSSEYNIQVFEARTQKKEFGLINAYTNEANMGVDRWLAMLAARNMSSTEGLVVIDLGTAITVDFILKDQHLGGWIAPGFDLMKAALFKNTQKVFGDDVEYGQLTYGKDTPECVDFGCKSQIIGMVTQAKQIMCEKTDDVEIFITGGNKNILLASNLFNQLCPRENLVLDGLTLFVD